MLKQTLAVLAIACLTLPACVSDSTPSVVGTWQMTAATVNGEPQNDKGIAKSKMQFNKDGTALSFKDGKIARKGFYEFRDDGRLYLYEDENGNGKLEEAEKTKKENFEVSREGDILTLGSEVELGEESFKIVATLELDKENSD